MSLEFWYMLPVAMVFATIALGTGVEGATFFSPFFVLVLGIDPTTAIGAGLVTEVFGFSSGLYAYSQKNLIDYRMGGTVLLASIPMALVGAYATHHVPDDVLKIILAMGLVAVAGSFLRSPSDEMMNEMDAAARQPSDRAERCRMTPDGEEICYTVMDRTEGVTTGGIGGLFIGMVSTGLGELNGYLFLQRCRVPAPVAIATSVFIVATTACIASISHIATFIEAGGASLYQLLSLLLFTVPGVLIGGQIGPRLTERIPERVLSLGMGVLFMLVSLTLLADVLLR